MADIKKYFSHIINGTSQRLRNYLYVSLKKAPVIFSRKQLLIVRLDAIGDYILFRNCLIHIKNYKEFEGYKISLLGNVLWKDLAERFDSEIIDYFHWINPSILYNFSRFSFERSLLLLKLKLHGFSIVIHPVHSRMLDVDEFISALGAHKLIASSGDEINYKPGEKAIADSFYNRIINVPDHSVFEFYRNTHFINQLTGINISNIKFEINLRRVNLSKIKIIIAPGAGHANRRWPEASFASVIRMISENLPAAMFYICGSMTDSRAANLIIEKASECRIENICGKLSLVQFSELMNESVLLIANESSAVHLAAAINIPAVCISNGNMFGRFNPYPAEMNKQIYTLYSDKVFNDPFQFASNVEKTKVQSTTNIAQLNPAEVYEASINLLKYLNIKN